MLLFFGTRDHVDTVNQFVNQWAPELRAHILTLAYENVSFRQPLPGGVCVFMDFERLLPGELSLARRLAAALQAFPEKYAVLNPPARWIGRLRLLEVLHERGLNDFRAFRPDALPGDLRFPVFLRSELDHGGPATPLLRSSDELDQALAGKAFQDPQLRRHLMVTEFCNCLGADGFFRKYSVLRIAGTFIPRHVHFSRNWVQKYNDFVDEAFLAEEQKFLENCPHLAPVAEIFRLAGVDYGRIDYGLHNGRIQVWEINTNPTIVPRPENTHPLRLAPQTEPARRIAGVLQELAASRNSEPARPFRSLKLLPARVLQHFSRRSHVQHRK